MSYDLNERALAEFGFVGIEGHECKFEQINFDNEAFFLREHIDNRGSTLTLDHALSRAEDTFHTVAFAVPMENCLFYWYDKTEGVWSVLEYEVAKNNPIEFEINHVGHCTQSYLEKKHQIILARSPEEFVEQLKRDKEHLIGEIELAHEEDLKVDSFLGGKETRAEASKALDVLNEKRELLKQVETVLDKYLALQAQIQEAKEKAAEFERKAASLDKERLEIFKEHLSSDLNRSEEKKQTRTR